MTTGPRVSVAIAFSVGLLLSPMMAQAKQDPMMGAAALSAAIHIARDCDGIGLVGGQSEADFLQSASKTLKRQGFRRQAVLKLVYYSKAGVLAKATDQLLAGVGASLADKRALCGHGRKVVGANDLVGQFLERN